jgi:hypothetical protein
MVLAASAGIEAAADNAKRRASSKVFLTHTQFDERAEPAD